MNLQELGAVFKQERERRGLSVEDVVQRTKISRRNLLAIEAGRKDDLPHPVYAKGFVKNYARLLDLDPEEFAAALAQEYFVADDDFGNDPTRDKPISMNAARSVGGQGRRTGVRGLLVLLLVAAVAGAILWSTLLAPKPVPAPPAPAPQAAPAEPEPAPAPQDSAAEAQSQAPPQDGDEAAIPPAEQHAAEAEAAPIPAPKPEPAPAPEPAKPAAEPAKPVVQPQAAAPAPKPAPNPEPQAVQPAPAPVVPAPVVAATGTRIMEIRASQICWVNAEVDGTIVLDMLLQPGEAKAIHFDKALTVKFGNAGGVKVTLDNAPFPLNAQSGEVRTVTIP